MLKIQHRVTGGSASLVSRRCIHENVTPGIDRLRKVIFNQHIAMRYVFERIKTAIRIGYFKSIAYMAIADECIGSRIKHESAVDKHPVIVIPFILRFTGVCPYTVIAFDHIKWNINDGNLYFLGIGSVKSEGHPRIGFNARVPRAIEIVRRSMCRIGIKNG